MVLTASQARTFYDRFGRLLDTQAFYEDAALDDLVAHAEFEHANSVFELGCGTGRFASRLLTKHLPCSASYLGIDISKTMVEIAAQRISPYSDRAKVVLSGDSMSFPLPDHSVDRVVSTYVLDLLSEADVRQFLAEAHRVLTTDGRLCLVSLTQGSTVASRVVCRLWWRIFRLYAPLVGGCRPVQLHSFIDPQRWTIHYHRVVTPFGVPSEILIARPGPTPNAAFN